VFRLASFPASFRKRFLLSQTSDPLQRPRWALPALSVIAAEATSRMVQAPPLRFLAPSAFEDQRIGLLLRFHPERLPSTTFHTSSRALSPLTRVALFHATDALGVVISFRASPCLLTAPARHWSRSPLEVSSEALSNLGRLPRGLRRLTVPVPATECCIHRRSGCSPGRFQSLSRGLPSGLDRSPVRWLTRTDRSSAPGLCFGAVLAVS